MRSSVYLFAVAIIAATSTPALATEMAIEDSSIATYSDAYAETTYEAGYSTPYSENYVSGEEVVFIDETTPVEVTAIDAPLLEASLVEAEYIATPSDFTAFAPEFVESAYPVENIADTSVTMSETIDGIVYETVIATPQTY